MKAFKVEMKYTFTMDTLFDQILEEHKKAHPAPEGMEWTARKYYDEVIIEAKEIKVAEPETELAPVAA